MSTTGTLPSQAAFFHAILRHLASRPEGDRRQGVHEAMPDLLGLSDVQRNERLANLPHLRYRHRSGWGLSMLKAAGYVDNTAARGMWCITDKGRKLLEAHPDGFDENVGRQLLRESRRQHSAAPNGPDLREGSQDETELTPDEQIDAAVNELCANVAKELLEQILRMPPAFFESLVLDLLHALGYGSTEDDLQRVGGSGDGGIDGIISLDRLGFEKIYVQAKRWQGSVGRPEIQAFYGAISARRAKRGVFITTSTFTREAREFEAHVSESVVLIDGARLTSLMIEHGVGVTHYRTVRLPKLDMDYFDSE
jgi:restriction system protein